MTAATTNLALAHRRRTLARPRLPRLRAIAGLVLLSRLIVWVAAAAGAHWGHRVAGWKEIDPTGITRSFGAVGNVLLAPVLRWDALGYVSIAEHGYRHGTTVFYPGYPLLMAGVGSVVGSDVVGGLLISVACFGVAMYFLHRLTEHELGRPAADATVLFLAFAPLSLFFTALYTESLFLALSVGAIYAARTGRWWQAYLLSALAAVTRVTGILLLVPIALWQWQRYRRVRSEMGWMLLVPLALGGFMVYMHAQGYAWLAPYRDEQSARRYGGPWGTLIDAARAAAHGVQATVGGTPPISPSIAGPFSIGFESIVLLVVLALAVVALVAVFRRLPLGYGAYSALALLVSLATEARFQPLYSVDRYILTIFPLWMAAGSWLGGRRALRPVLMLSAALLAFYSFEFATWAFIA